MNKVIVSQQDLAYFLSYCISWGYKATAINKQYVFGNEMMKVIFILDKGIKEEDYAALKSNLISFDLYTDGNK